MLSFSFFWYQPSPALAATYDWFQEDWSGGADTDNFPFHPDNQTGWTKYFSKDAEITAGTELTLTGTAASTTQTTDTDFNAGSFDKTEVSGAGEAAEVELIALAINDINSWAPLSVAPSGVRSGGSLVYPGSGLKKSLFAKQR